MNTNIIEVREELKESIVSRIGGGMIDIEVTPEQLDTCINLALKKLKQRSDAVVEESLILLTLQQNQKEYTLPDEIIEVQQVYRRGFGRGLSGSNMDPFALSAYSNIYMCGMGGASRVGGLVTYDLSTSYLKVAGKMFGMYMNYWFNPNTHKITFVENPRADEEVIALHCYNIRPDYMLIQDQFAGIWIENWALAELKAIVGEIRDRFSSLSGANGQIQQNGSALKQESKAEKEALEKELSQYTTGGDIALMPFLG